MNTDFSASDLLELMKTDSEVRSYIRILWNKTRGLDARDDKGPRPLLKLSRGKDSSYE